MESTIWLADGFVIITGEIGSGKTTLLQSFLGELGDDVVYAMVSQTQLSPSQFLQAVLTEFGFKPFKQRKVELLDTLNMFLIDQYSKGKKVVLIVDEAQNLTAKVLEEIRLISGIETHKEKVLRIILAGQPELKDTLESPELKQLVQRVRLRFHVGPLDTREMREYVARRVEVAGGSAQKLFRDDAYDVIYRFTGGVPRLINTLCDTALLCAFAEEKTTIGGAEILAAVDELNWKEHELSKGAYPDKPPRGDDIRPVDPLTRIEVRNNGEKVGEHYFGPGRVIIGRSPDNEIYIHSKFVSRHHAQLNNDESGCVIEDLNSTNGVFVGEERIKKHRLKNKDIISLGVHELVYHDLRDSATDARPSPLKEQQG
jgi:type II secretory pathway predicted ATPase ExeA